MKTVMLILLFFSTLIFGEPAVKNLMPIPQQIDVKDGQFRLAADFKIAVQGVDHQRLYNAATRTLRRLSNRTGLFF